eukprot:m.7700 g.7700  ORF g.7700 m.7700 type:complete len:1060 (-) comp8923_c0_seq1:41-3220(-)
MAVFWFGFLTLLHVSYASVGETSFDLNWRFKRGDDVASAVQCAKTTPWHSLGDVQCFGLNLAHQATSMAGCAQACCAMGNTCQTYQFCPAGAACVQGIVAANSCWVGAMSNCDNVTDGWVSFSRSAVANTTCTSSYCQPGFDDSTWRKVDAPHDFSIEPLPSRDSDDVTPVLALRNGTWLFHTGNDPKYIQPQADESSFTSVTVPHDWRTSPLNYQDHNAYGTYRRHFTLTPAQITSLQAGTLRLALGTVSSADQTYINGHQIGSTGSASSPGCRDFLEYRSYLVPAGAVNITGDNVLAVVVFSQGGKLSDPANVSFPGGLYDSGAPDERSGPFDPGASPGQKQTGYTVSGTAWYRKNFTLTTDDSHNRVFVRFDGIYMNSDVYVNGHFIGNRPYGYVTFEYDITSVVSFDSSNNIAIKVASFGSNSRWYAGAGLYRHTYLIVRPQTYIPMWGVHAMAAGSSVTAVVNISTAQVQAVTLDYTVLDPSGHNVASTTKKSTITEAGQVTATLDVGQAAIWSTDTPNLYRVEVVLSSSAGTMTANTTFGFRTIGYSATHGFILNGQPTLMYGGCVHHDNGLLGSAAIARADYRRVQQLKQLGYNAIRTSHNPVSPSFLDACDKLGMLVMEEAFDCFTKGKNSDDYHLYFADWWQRDVEAMVLRDRNRPSIVMWSIGNEIPIRTTPEGANYSAQLSAYIRHLDPNSNRAVTSAIPGISQADDSFASHLDVVGYNYGPDKYQPDHQRLPSRIMVGTESFPADSASVWNSVWNAEPYVLGDFIWTAIDYYGESSIGANGYNTPDLRACAGYCPQPFSYHISFCGDIDVVGIRKPQSYLRTVLFNASLMEMAVHAPVAPGEQEVIAKWGYADERQSWSWPSTSPPLSIVVYSKLPAVSLYLNGALVATQNTSTTYSTYFTVPYSPGNLTAAGLNSANEPVVFKTLVTANTGSILQLLPDRRTLQATRDDLSYVTIQVVDDKGRRDPNAQVTVTVMVTGAGELAALGSGDPTTTQQSVMTSSCRTYRGLCMAIVRPGKAGEVVESGSVTVTVEAEGFVTATQVLDVA